jgi:flagellin
MNKSMERISSGLRINSAADDAGGLAMGMKLSLEVAKTENVQSSVANAKSFVEAQSSALETAADIVSEMKTLKTQYDDATATADDKATYQSEFEDLQGQLTMLTGEKFNGEALFGSSTKQVSTTSDGSGLVNFGGIDLAAKLGSLTDSSVTLATATVADDPLTVPDESVTSVEDQMDNAFDGITSLIGTAGGHSSTLGFASSYLESKAANLEAARSRVMDADIVEESTNLSKYTMQYEATVAAIAQANSTQQTVMELLLFPEKK